MTYSADKGFAFGQDRLRRNHSVNEQNPPTLTVATGLTVDTGSHMVAVSLGYRASGAYCVSASLGGRSRMGCIIREIGGHSQITEKYSPVIINEKVGSLDVPMDETVYMEVADEEGGSRQGISGGSDWCNQL